MSRRITAIPVGSLTEGLRFYRDVLHFDVESRNRQSALLRSPDGSRYKLIVAPPPTTIQIEVGNPFDLVDAILATGCRLTSGMWNMDSRAVLEDPNGNRIIVERIPGAES